MGAGGRFCYQRLRRRREFASLTGVAADAFEAMVRRLRPAWEREVVAAKAKDGRPWGVGGLEDHLLVLLILYRCHLTQAVLGCLYGVDKSAISRSKRRIERIAAKVLGVRRRILVGADEAQALIVDGTEQPIQRPRRKQRCYYSGKRRRHTIKAELVAAHHEGRTRIVAVPPPAPGRTHDLTLRRRGPPVPAGGRVHADSAYQGYEKEHPATEIPYKRPPGGRLAKDEKEYNRALSSFRVRIEHVFARLKSFRILRDVFRYPRATYHATIRIVAGILNLQAGFEPR